MAIIKLKSSDDEIFETDIKIAKRSGTIKTMLEHCGIGDDQSEAVVPLPNVNSEILRRALEWANHHKDDPMTADDGDKNKCWRTDDISTWDADFLKLDQGTLFELISVANYLDIKDLLDVICKTVANMMKGQTPEEIRKRFNIANDLTATTQEQEQEQAQEDNASGGNQ